MAIQRHRVGRRMSGVVVHDGTVYLAGQVNTDASTTRGQMEGILAQIDALLASVGSSRARLLAVTIYLADMGEFEEMNRAWDPWVDPENPPARATVEARLAAPEYLVEVSAVAAL